MRREDRNARGQGAVQIFSARDATLLATFLGDETSDDFGDRVAFAGDVNGDGKPDLIAGGRLNDTNSFAAGMARVLSTVPVGLTSRTHSVSLLNREKQILEIHAGSKHARKLYFVLGTAGAIRPGIQLGSVNLPLSIDPYFLMTLGEPHALIFNNLARLDAKGQGKVAFVLPPTVPRSAAGLLLRHACLVLGPTGFEFASNAVPVTIKLFWSRDLTDEADFLCRVV